MPAYLVLLRAEIARFTQVGSRLRAALPECCSVPGLRRGRTACAARWPACAGPSQTTQVETTDLTRLCCSDPHLAVDSG